LVEPCEQNPAAMFPAIRAIELSVIGFFSLICLSTGYTVWN
jgi:hypothetical protein